MATRRALPNSAGSISMELYGDSTQVDAMLDHLEHVLEPAVIASNFLVPKVDPYIRMRARGRFASEGDAAVGGKWAPLKAATEQFRSSQGYGAAHPINHRTGELENYVTSSPLGIRIDPAIGATLIMPGQAPGNPELTKKVRTAQQGDGRTVKRPVMAVDTTDLGFVLTGLVEYVTRGLL